MGPGWSLSGDTDVTGQGILGGVPIKDLLDAGYNVATWDPRGFGGSGGLAEVDSPSYEARDVSTLISWVAAQPGVQLDAPGDPRMGMVGGSYGGGIQLVTAATDCRVDAIVPTIAWNSLATSLDKAGTYKAGWAGILTSSAVHRPPRPEVIAADGRVRPVDRDHHPLPAGLVHRPGTRPHSSTGSPPPPCSSRARWTPCSPLQEAVDNYEILRATGTRTSMLWFCGGHGVCLTDPGDTAAPEQATLAWLAPLRPARHVGRHRSGLQLRRPERDHLLGARLSAAPAPCRSPATGSGTLPLVSTGGSGPVTSVPAGQELGSLVAPVTPAPATTAVDVPITFPRSGVIVGAPRLTLAYSGTVPAHTAADPGLRPARRHLHRARAREPGDAGPGDARRPPPTR